MAHLNTSEQLDEPALVTAAGTGDSDAWEVLYLRLYPRLWAYVARRVDAGHVEDTVSETMMRAVRGIDSYQPGPAGFEGWVFGIARRVCADHHRRRIRLRRQDGLAAGMAEVIEEGRAPGDPAVAADDHAELRRAFELLLPGDQQVLELRVIAGLSVDQAAAVLEKAPGAVRTAQSRALERLRQLIKKHNDRPAGWSLARAVDAALAGPAHPGPSADAVGAGQVSRPSGGVWGSHGRHPPGTG